MFDLYQHQTISFIKYCQVVFESTVRSLRTFSLWTLVRIAGYKYLNFSRNNIAGGILINSIFLLQWIKHVNKFFWRLTPSCSWRTFSEPLMKDVSHNLSSPKASTSERRKLNSHETNVSRLISYQNNAFRKKSSKFKAHSSDLHISTQWQCIQRH